jgi:hypothetical protein
MIVTKINARDNAVSTACFAAGAELGYVDGSLGPIGSSARRATPTVGRPRAIGVFTEAALWRHVRLGPRPALRDVFGGYFGLQSGV